MVQMAPVKDNDSEQVLSGGQKVAGEKFEMVVLGSL
jgi:hypothetical protein